MIHEILSSLYLSLGTRWLKDHPKRQATRVVCSRFQLGIESLEHRFAPACTFSGGDTVFCDGSDDTVELRIFGTSTQVFAPEFLGSTTANQLRVFGGGGANSVFVNDAAFGGGDQYRVTGTEFRIASFAYLVEYQNIRDFRLHAGAGSDTVTLANAGNTLDDIGNVMVDTGNGNDVLNVIDTGYAGGDIYRVTDRQIILPSTLGLIVTYTNVENPRLSTGAGNDTITLANAGNTLDNIGNVSIDAGGGVNVLAAIDTGYSGGDAYRITENQILLPHTLGLIATFSGIGDLRLSTGAGNDSISVGNSYDTLDFLPRVIVAAGAGSDTLNIIDRGYFGVETYEVNDHNLNLPHSLGEVVTFTDIEALVLFPAAGGSLIIDQHDPNLFVLVVSYSPTHPVAPPTESADRSRLVLPAVKHGESSPLLRGLSRSWAVEVDDLPVPAAAKARRSRNTPSGENDDASIAIWPYCDPDNPCR